MANKSVRFERISKFCISIFKYSILITYFIVLFKYNAKKAKFTISRFVYRLSLVLRTVFGVFGFVILPDLSETYFTVYDGFSFIIIMALAYMILFMTLYTVLLQVVQPQLDVKLINRFHRIQGRLRREFHFQIRYEIRIVLAILLKTFGYISLIITDVPFFIAHLKMINAWEIVEYFVWEYNWIFISILINIYFVAHLVAAIYFDQLCHNIDSMRCWPDHSRSKGTIRCKSVSNCIRYFNKLQTSIGIYIRLHKIIDKFNNYFQLQALCTLGFFFMHLTSALYFTIIIRVEQINQIIFDGEFESISVTHIWFICSLILDILSIFMVIEYGRDKAKHFNHLINIELYDCSERAVQHQMKSIEYFIIQSNCNPFRVSIFGMFSLSAKFAVCYFTTIVLYFTVLLQLKMAQSEWSRIKNKN